MGDQVELTSIQTLLDKCHCPAGSSLSIGSVKTMIGHLLTAAGAAGFIKTILSMNEKFLPPSLNFSAPALNSPLNSGRLKVQTMAEDWNPDTVNSTRKAGISAFGFGGINAHILVEEYKKKSTAFVVKNIEPQQRRQTVPCAIVGMETIAKDCDGLSHFKSLIFNQKKLAENTPEKRWRKTTGTVEQCHGFYLDDITIQLGEFHIPPNQIDDILCQHIILLKAVKGALEDADISPRPKGNEKPRHHMGCAVGIEFDYGATDFHLRWKMNHLNEDFKDKISPPLTFNRTLGALGGIVASRVAREFKFGGPCFTLSADNASGIKAIETGIHSLGALETDVFVCGCVDLAGDIRQQALIRSAKPHSNEILPSEGAAAVVLKRLDDAIKDKDNIYGVITGTAGASGDIIPGELINDPAGSESLYSQSLKAALQNAESRFDDIGLYECCTSGMTASDACEARALASFSLNSDPKTSCYISSTASVIGNTKSASALFSVIKTALCLYHQVVPSNAALPSEYKEIDSSHFLFTKTPVDWDTSDAKKTRTACAASMTVDGAFSHVILEEHPIKEQQKRPVLSDKKDPGAKGARTQRNRLVVKTNPKKIDPHTIAELQQAVVRDNHALPADTPAGLEAGTAAAFDPHLIAEGTQATSRAHEKFLEFSEKNLRLIEEQFKALTTIAKDVVKSDTKPSSPDRDHETNRKAASSSHGKAPFLDRDQCLEFAIGKAGNVLGEEFDIIDSYPVRVRLPDEPLMLVDRIMDIKGDMLSLGSGKIITQHDVKENAWYLDGGKTPVSISIEAGQADLFLCAWLGIDHVVKGTRKYRLLDAKVTFHRTLPEPGETIEYHIEIDRFLKQGDVFLFFFHYKGYIDNQLLISMRDGCAGFFTEDEVENSGGIILKTEDLKPVKSKTEFRPLIDVEKTRLSDKEVGHLRQGNLKAAFGNTFDDIRLGNKLTLPGGRMHLIDRVLELDPNGGRYGSGLIVAQADIHPDDWFLTCHFIDDKVMPGTLMYECCAHALRIFTQRMGWISDKDDVYYDVVLNNESDLKCRGPVTPETQKARYEIEIKQMGYDPEPYVIADAHMFSDNLRIVLYKNMGMKIKGLTKKDLESFWRKK